jgi:hypothetical protein
MISAGVGAASGALGIAQGLGLGRRAAERNQLEQQRKLSEQQASIQNAAQMKMWKDTNYEAQVGELKKAGLNPGLLYGKGGGGGTTTGAGVGGGQAANAAAIQSANTQSAGMGIQGAMAIKQMQLMESQAKNLDADTLDKLKKPAGTEAGTVLAGAQKAKTEEETRGHKLANDFREWLQAPNEYGESIAGRQAVLINNKLVSEMQKIQQEISNLGIDFTKGKSEIERIKADTNLKKQVYDQLEKLNPMEIQSVTKKLEMLKNDPANTELGQWASAILGWLGELAGLGLKGAMTKQIITPKTKGGGNTTVINWGEQ